MPYSFAAVSTFPALGVWDVYIMTSATHSLLLLLLLYPYAEQQQQHARCPAALL